MAKREVNLTKLKQQRSGHEKFVERIRMTVQRELTGRRPTIDDDAVALHVSSRTLQRRLQDQGFGFQRVLDEARYQFARHYLNTPPSTCTKLPISDTRTETPSSALFSPGKEFHRLTDAKSNVQWQSRNWVHL